MVRQNKGAATASLAAVAIASITIYASTTGQWVLTALPVGFLFGLFLQKGDLCGTSAFSEVVLARDWRKVWGLWIAIVVSMVWMLVGDGMEESCAPKITR